MESRIRLQTDRVNHPPGYQTRHLLNHAAIAISETTASAMERKDSTESDKQPSKSTSSSLKSLISSSPHVTSSQQWEAVMTQLRKGNISCVKRALVKLQKHNSESNSSVFNRCRAVTILVVIESAEVWQARSRIPRSLAKKLREGVSLGSLDCTAISAWLYIRGLFKVKNPQSLIKKLKLAANTHSPSQAILGCLMCSRLNENTSRILAGDGTHLENHTKVTRGELVNFETLKMFSDVKAGSIVLERAASRGHFLAIEKLGFSLFKNEDGKQKRLLGKRERESRKLWPFELVTENISGEDYFLAVQKGAHDEIAHCVLRVAKMMRKGIGCSSNREDAVKWTRKAADMNLKEAVKAVCENAETEICVIRRHLSGTNLPSNGFVNESSLNKTNAERKIEQNKKVIKINQEKLEKWKDGEEYGVVASIFRICNLQAKLSGSVCEALLRLIFERDRGGWTIDG